MNQQTLNRSSRRGFLQAAGTLAASGILSSTAMPSNGQIQTKPRNIIFILSDDHRYDFMSFMPGAPTFLTTPNLDRMAKQGAHLANAFVSTSLCSPSRASILTGQYMHHHRVIDNQNPVPEGTSFFSQFLQEAGYQTAFIGKWHMGHEADDPRPGFHHWVSFKGQGTYFDPELNINGSHQTFTGYTTGILTSHALDWLAIQKENDKPFFLYLSYKAVHFPFQPAPRNQTLYEKETVQRPDTMANTERNYQTQPHWVRERRYSIHGVDHMETTPYDLDPTPSYEDFYRNYAETVHSLDEYIGKVLDYLDDRGLSKSTLVVYMGDNGFAMGEHGFYDKRDAFEESIRIPMLAYAPGWIKPNTTITELVQNIDIAPTLLAAAGIKIPKQAKMDGASFLPLLLDQNIPWRDHILYEYHWEWNFPATPTTFAIRNERYKYIYYHGIWDLDGFYDLETDPVERHNLIQAPAYQDLIEAMKKQLFDELEQSGGLNLPIRRPTGERLDQRKNRN